MKKLFFLISLCLVFGGCASSPSQPTYTPTSLKTILVLPFEVYSPEQKEVFYVPFKGIISGPIMFSATETLTQILKERLQAANLPYQFKFLSKHEAEVLISESLSETRSFPEFIKNLSLKTSADAILYGKVYRYKEREGSGFSVNEPASVAFTLVLYDGASGRIIWSELFDETQKPLSENLLNFKIYKKIKWLTAKELAANGIEILVQKFPAEKR
ncbi:hypothetical protein F1847_01630 [Thermodesulfobacterium sp. TA1]|uniref:hypothetical protein n=1 Tax=Thermodesulfobacterium sp. TA1 TaxID=2234087 RepID=UPI001231D27E|nr:hypothetical protein [Thermodesulfobacterium sp. TA1]QER41501.1 hypothetical protein F1847_01630 [Thermodesulfobacterium sp. TA1]